jgi:hypothetical protein
MNRKGREAAKNALIAIFNILIADHYHAQARRVKVVLPNFNERQKKTCPSPPFCNFFFFFLIRFLPSKRKT